MPSLGLFPEGLLLSIQTWTSAASHLQLHCTRLASYQFTLARVFLLISMAFLSSSPSSDTYRSCHTITTMPLLKPVVGQLNAFCVFFFPVSTLKPQILSYCSVLVFRSLPFPISSESSALSRKADIHKSLEICRTSYFSRRKFRPLRIHWQFSLKLSLMFIRKLLKKMLLSKTRADLRAAHWAKAR